MKRVVISGVAGGLVMFVWGAFVHMATPLGQAGFSGMADEAATVAALRSTLDDPDPAIHLFPWDGHDAAPDSPEMTAFVERVTTGPTGFLVYQSRGRSPTMTRQLLIQAAGNVFAGLILAGVLCGLGTTCLWRGATTGAALGAFAWSTILIPYWNWYRFPGAFVTAALVSSVVGWALAGLVIGAVLARADKMEHN